MNSIQETDDLWDMPGGGIMFPDALFADVVMSRRPVGCERYDLGRGIFDELDANWKYELDRSFLY